MRAKHTKSQALDFLEVYKVFKMGTGRSSFFNLKNKLMHTFSYSSVPSGSYYPFRLRIPNTEHGGVLDHGWPLRHGSFIQAGIKRKFPVQLYGGKRHTNTARRGLPRKHLHL